MQTAWDYTVLADAYLRRPDYSVVVLDEIKSIAGVGAGDDACDIGAGVAHLTLHLAGWGMNVVAVEPNDAMRRNGQERTAKLANVRWVEAVSEDTKQAASSFDLVSFGSSFNVADRQKAMAETHRILRPGAWFTCMWNHRDLDDPVQASIEAIFQRNIDGYSYGTRREDQTAVIRDSGLFERTQKLEGPVVHQQTVGEIVEAWRSHATLHRQAGAAFASIIQQVENYLESLDRPVIEVPYTTRAWVARRAG